MRKLLILTLILIGILSAPALASETARDNFLARLQNCLDLYQSKQADFQSLDLNEEGTYSYTSGDQVTSSTSQLEHRINFGTQQAAVMSSYSDSAANTAEVPVPRNSSYEEYYVDGLHYFSAYDDAGQPISGQYYYDNAPYTNILYADVRSSMPDFTASGTGLTYLARVLPADCFVQAGEQAVCNVDQADFDQAYNVLAERVQAGDIEAQAALDIIYPAFVGYEYRQDDFLRPLNPENCETCIPDEKIPALSSSTYSSNYKFTVDNDSLDTRTISSSRFSYNPALPEVYDAYRTVVNTSLNARTGQFEKSSESINSGVLMGSPEASFLSSVTPAEPSAETETTYYENTTASHSMYVYSNQALDLSMPAFTEHNSQPAPVPQTGTSYWYLINY